MQTEPLPILVGLDIGTSGARALAFRSDGLCLAQGRATFPTSYGPAGWAEQQPDDWWQAAIKALHTMAVQLGARRRAVAGIGLTGQCPTLACLLPSGQVVGPGLLYQDNRAEAEARLLIQRFGFAAIHRRTGQAPSPFYLLPKLLWLNQHQPGWQEEQWVVVQPRDLVAWRLSGRLATDPTHAACTLAYDLANGDWARDWLRALDLERLIWPEILPCCSVQGELTAEAAALTGLVAGTPIIVGAADSICAAYGAQASERTVLCEVTGTSTCLHLMVEQPVAAHTVNTYPHVEPGQWCAEVGLNATGAALVWLSALLRSSPADLLSQAATVAAGADGLLFLPHLAGGERDEPARCGAFIGLRLDHSPAHLARAVLEGIVYALRQRVELLTAAGCPVKRMITCGGTAPSALWSQIKADILTVPVSAISPPDTTAWGAALIVARTLGIPTASSQSLYHCTPGHEHAAIYDCCYERFCRLEALLTHAEDEGAFNE